MTPTIIERNDTRCTLWKRDCLPFMRDLPDKAFDLAIVDPPFRSDNQPTQTMRGFSLEMKAWNLPPNREWFSELFRVSRNQIIHGGNYFTEFLPPNNNWIVWYKNNDGVGFSMCELFWCSVTKNVKLFDFRPMGKNGTKIHPTQKPVELYSWLLANYAEPGQTILDTHLGSGSHAIACLNHGYNLTACELDEDYFKAATERIQREANQGVLI